MPNELVESSAKTKKREKPSYAVVSGKITNNCDLINQGKVKVRIPSMDQEVWARLVAPGGGDDRGLFFTPNIDDEVLVLLNHNDPADAFIVGGLWSTQGKPPANAIQSTTKRVLKTGQKAGLGHSIEFDDALQSITITSSTGQRIVMDPTQIKLSAGPKDTPTATITLGVEGQITLESKLSIKLSSALIQLDAKVIEVDATVSASLTSNANCTIQGKPVMIN
jgi:uncharacterized protein involved in type VI secretion and phage assembly